MADDNIATADVVIKVNRNSGNISGGSSDDSIKILKEIRDELRKGGKEAKKSGKLGLSGSLGAASKLLGGSAAGLFGLGGAALSIPGSTTGPVFEGDKSQRYTQALIDGEDVILGVNRKTDEIEQILTQRQAAEQGIFDFEGNIQSNIALSDKKVSEIFKDYERQKGLISATNDELLLIATETLKQKKIDEDITKSKERQLSLLNSINSSLQSSQSNSSRDTSTPSYLELAYSSSLGGTGGSRSGITGGLNYTPADPDRVVTPFLELASSTRR